MLEFRPPALDMKGMIDSYTFKYGEGSCQHSFVSSFCLYGKYGDKFCERDGVLYVLRSKRCRYDERVYLFPMCDPSEMKGALRNVFDDAHSHDCRVKFETLTECAKNVVMELYPGKFSIESSRDYAEYVYSVDKLMNLPGGELARKRQYANKFKKDFGGRYRSEMITPEYFPGILDFQARWLEDKKRLAPDPYLDIEDEEIKIAFRHFDELGLSGIVLLIDGEIRGYFFGCPLSDECFTDIVNKADRNITGIYHVLVGEFLRKCCRGYSFINRQEDLGVPGLRKIKSEYRPDFMINKFILTEASYE